MDESIAAVFFADEMNSVELQAIISDAAERWADPEYEPRQTATQETLRLDNRFTYESVSFAVNQQVHLLATPALREWIGTTFVDKPRRVVVVNPGNIPFAELQDFVASILLGHSYRGKLSSRSPWLLPAFADDLRDLGAVFQADLTVDMPGLDPNDGLIGSGFDDTMSSLQEAARAAGIPERRLLLRGSRFSVAVIGDGETEASMEQLAEDALLHEGLGCRNVAIVWAPAGESPDPFLDAMARFRAVFPAHPSTIGSLKMQIAYYEAADLPHAYADDGSFLVSKGDPEVQRPAHIRWVEYEDPDDVVQWLNDNRDRIQLVSTTDKVRDRLSAITIPVIAVGDAQRPGLGWDSNPVGVVPFLKSL